MERESRREAERVLLPSITTLNQTRELARADFGEF
jgi:hypothetical protein